MTNKELKTHLLEFSGDLTSKLNLDFCSLDIIDTTVGLFVMEINSGIMTKNYVEIVPNGKSIIKEIYRKAIKCMLEIK